jgi:hypothetical protein
MFLRLECSLLRSVGFSWRPQRKSYGKKTFDQKENFWRKPGPDPSGRSLDPEEIQPDQDPLRGKRKKVANILRNFTIKM